MNLQKEFSLREGRPLEGCGSDNLETCPSWCSLPLVRNGGILHPRRELHDDNPHGHVHRDTLHVHGRDGSGAHHHDGDTHGDAHGLSNTALARDDDGGSLRGSPYNNARFSVPVIGYGNANKTVVEWYF